MDRPPNAAPDSADGEGPADAIPLGESTLLDAVGDGGFRIDPDGYFVAATDGFADLVGYSREELRGLHVSRLLDPESIAHAAKTIQDRLREGTDGTVTLTLPLYTATDEVVPCEAWMDLITRGDEFRGLVGVAREVADEEAEEVREGGQQRHAFQALAQASADGIITLDDDSIIRYANPAVERILGYTPEELVGSSKMKIIPERLRRTHAEALDRYLETGTKHIDWTYVELPGSHKDGHEVPLAISLNEFEHQGTHYFVGTFRDISQRKEAERELRASEQRYRALIEATTDVVWRAGAEGDLVAELSDWCEFTDQRPEEAEGDGWLDAVHPEDRDRVRERWTEAVAAADPAEFEYRVRRHDGEWRWFNVRAAPVLEDDGSVREWVGTSTDVTERKEYEQALTTLHDVSRRLLNTSSRSEVSRIVVDTVVSVLDHPGVGIYLYDEDDDVLEPAANSSYITELFGTMPTFEADDSAITWRAFRDGETLTFDDVRETDLPYTHETPLRSGIWVPLGDYGVLALVSDEVGAFEEADRKLADLLAATAEAALERADRERRLRRQNDRLESFASMLAHELRNPISIAQIYMHDARNGNDGAFDEIATALDRIDGIIDVLLVLARGSDAVGPGEPVDLATIAEETWSNVASRGAELALESTRTVVAEPNHLRHLLENLFENAVEHGGSDVTVRVGALPDASGFYVEDDGTGIPDEEREAVFESGYSTGKHGSGLGLTFVMQLVDAYGWDVTVTDGVEGGARFEFTGVDGAASA